VLVNFERSLSASSLSINQLLAVCSSAEYLYFIQMLCEICDTSERCYQKAIHLRRSRRTPARLHQTRVQYRHVSSIPGELLS